MTSEIVLDPSQEKAVELVCSAPFGVVTGGPGCGKTTCLRFALDRLDERGASYRLAAPTGKAARRMREATGRAASTVHRLLEFGPDELTGELGFRRNARRPIDADLVVVDESSMLDVRLADALTAAIDQQRTRLVLVGDANQLPSVGPGRVFGDIIAAGTVPVAQLTTLHRAAAETWVCSQAPVILSGHVPDLAERRDFLWLERADRGQALEALLEVVFRELPARGAAPADIQVLIPMRVGPAGCALANKRLQALLNPERDNDPQPWVVGTGDDARTLRLRDRVIQTRNDYQLEVANGEVGEVEAIHHEPTPCPACNGTGMREAADWEQTPSCEPCGGKGKRPPCLVVRYPDDAGDRRVTYGKGDVYALDLAYALTVHKSQGSQWPWVVMLCHSTHTKMLTRQLLYTGITRAQKGVALIGDQKGIAAAVKNVADAQRNTWLAQELREGAAPADELDTEEPEADPAPPAPPAPPRRTESEPTAEDLTEAFADL